MSGFPSASVSQDSPLDDLQTIYVSEILVRFAEGRQIMSEETEITPMLIISDGCYQTGSMPSFKYFFARSI
jgi:hypothetical protein